jgi:tetratricopeptide (TPR) repeat protein
LEIRKEQVVLVLTAALVGWLTYGSLSSNVRRGGTVKRANAPALTHTHVIDPALVLPEKRELAGRDVRELFSPPSDTRPLPPLEFVPPPQVPLAILRPPPEPGPAPKLYGRFLRVEPTSTQVPGLFAQGDDVSFPDGEDEASAAASATPDPVAKVELSAAERAERVASHKKLYDWVRTVELKFGQITNRDRYALARRTAEDILFVEFNPATGKPRLPGQAPVPLARANVAEFGFADTIPNQLELRRAEFGDPLAMAEYDAAISFAIACVDQHVETPRALEIAAEMFTRAAAVAREDPLPRLGLARCYEVGFDFERAFQEYRSLMAGAYARNPLVLVRLAVLEARFRMFDRAEERMREAERYGRTAWHVQFCLGRFLRERGRPEEAVEHLRLASQYEPTGPEAKHERARIRLELARALLATGNVTEGADWYDKARQADPTEQSAQAGIVSASVMSGGRSGGTMNGGSVVDPRDTRPPSESAGFELLLATGLESSLGRDPASAARAEQTLRLAASADPLRASFAWRALSYLADTTGYPEEALRMIELALENDPTDAWSLYQRGRMLAARDDLDGAVDSFTRALDIELDLPDVLAALGEVANRRGDYAAAERYFERALALEPKLASVGALRGVNFLEMGALGDAEAAFKQALSVVPDHPGARSGIAWCHYARGDATEALARFRELDDNRRAEPETDPYRVHARAEIARISDHLEKVVWSDRFERRTLLNGWETEEKTGPQVAIHDGRVSLAGTFKSNGRARLWQLKNAGAFVAFEARITIKSGTTARVGLFVSRESSRAGDTQVEAEVTVSRHNDPGKNTIQTRLMKRGEEELAYTDVAGFDWKLDQPMVVRIERTGDSSDTRVRLFVDGFPVLDDKPMPNLGRTNADLRLGIFAEGQTGRQVQVEIDDVELVYRERQ